MMVLKKTVVLYTRDGCHLCENVAAMLEELTVVWQSVDIETDPLLEEKYGLIIPVVSLPGAEKELAFPFDAQTLGRFLRG